MKKTLVLIILLIGILIIGCSKGVELPTEVANEIETKCGDPDVDKDLCTFDLAIENQDENFCSALSRDDDKNACIAEIRKDSSFLIFNA